MIKTICRDLGRIGQLGLQVLIFMTQGEITNPSYQKYKPRKAFKRFIGQGGTSLTYDFPTFIVLDYTMSSGTYVKDHKMFIPIIQVIKLITFLANTIRVVEDPKGELYYWDADHGNALSMYHLPADKMNEKIITLQGLAGNHNIQSYPTIVIDYQDNRYEGAIIHFDRTENQISLSYDELRMVHYILSRTDFVTLSQAMVNTSSLWTNVGITKHLDIETTKAGDWRQSQDLSRSTINQPTTNMPVNVFQELKTIDGGSHGEKDND